MKNKEDRLIADIARRIKFAARGDYREEARLQALVSTHFEMASRRNYQECNESMQRAHDAVWGEGR